MGGKSSGPSLSAGPLEKTQAKILKDVEANLGGPFRQAITPSVLSTIGGPGVFQTELPGIDRSALEQQFQQARSNILETSPARGGQLQGALGNLERGRAFDIGSAINQGRQRGIERALGLTSSFLPGAGQFGQAVGNEQARRMAQFQAQNAAQQQAGSGIGGLLGLGGGKAKR